VLRIIKAAYEINPAFGLLVEVLQHVPTAMNRDSQDTPEVRV
jgi:hypothetical protein